MNCVRGSEQGSPSAGRPAVWRIPTSAYLSKYGHPNGWRIVQNERDWSLRGFGERGIAGINSTASPKRWWEVHRGGDRQRRVVESFNTLREARTWCDEHTAPNSPETP